MDTPTKACSKCGEVKPLDEFYVDRDKRDGRQAACAACERARCRAWREANLEYVRAREAIRHEGRGPAWRKRRAEISARYDRKNREKRRARQAVARAIERGRLAKPDRCEDCGERFPAHLLHGHHDDYEKPLDVAWLCSPCHGRRHARYTHLAPGAGADPDNVEA